MVEIKEKLQVACLNCGNTWLVERKPGRNAQCSKCWAYAVISLKKYREVAEKLKALATPEELQKFREIYDLLKSEDIIPIHRFSKYIDLKVNAILSKTLES